MQPYSFKNTQYLAGQWIQGTSAHVIKNINPFNQTTILELHAASKADVDTAYASAQEAFGT